MKIRSNTLITLFVALSAFCAGCSKSDSNSQLASHDHGEGQHHHGEGADLAEPHDESEKKDPGPNGGRIIEDVEPRMEFLVMDDRRIQLTRLNEGNEPIPFGDEEISLVGGDRASPTMLAFQLVNGQLVSDRPLPDGPNVPIVLQVKSSPSADVVREKFNVNMSECPSCDFPEYACICGHEEE